MTDCRYTLNLPEGCLQRVLWPIDVTDLGVPKKENEDGDSEVANASFSPSLIFLIEIIGTFDQAKERENHKTM